MYNLGWTEPAMFTSEEDQAVLHHATARYHAFLDLMAASPADFLVPTLDIDLIWHTHQLAGPRYLTDTKTYVGRKVDQ